MEIARRRPGRGLTGKGDVDMTEGSIFMVLLRFSLPLLVGNLFQQLYNMVDTWVIGQSGDNAAYAAVGSVGPIINILIGVNDVWHYTDNNEVEADRFEKMYRILVQDLLEKLPDVKIMIMGCFVLDGYFTHENFEFFSKEVSLRAAAAKKIAEEFGLPFIDLQARFDAAMARYPESSHWLKDGVHPAPAGHKLIADAWIETFETLGL